MKLSGWQVKYPQMFFFQCFVIIVSFANLSWWGFSCLQAPNIFPSNSHLRSQKWKQIPSTSQSPVITEPSLCRSHHQGDQRGDLASITAMAWAVRTVRIWRPSNGKGRSQRENKTRGGEVCKDSKCLEGSVQNIKQDVLSKWWKAIFKCGAKSAWKNI